MEVNIWESVVVLVAFTGLAIIGGRLLAASVTSRSMSHKALSLLGVSGCLVAFIMILKALDPT